MTKLLLTGVSLIAVAAAGTSHAADLGPIPMKARGPCDPYVNYSCLDAYLGDDPFTRFIRYTTGAPSEAEQSQTSAERAQTEFPNGADHANAHAEIAPALTVGNEAAERTALLKGLSFAQHLAATLGTTMIDNRPGANTTIGSKAAAAAEFRTAVCVSACGSI